MEKVVFVTIGEAPRLDLAKTFNRFFKDYEQVSQAGLLNGLTREEAEAKLSWTPASRATLTSRFVDGAAIVMDAAKVEAALQAKINQLEKQGTDIIVILCTGAFDNLRSNVRLIEAEKVTIPLVKEQFPGKKVGIIVPLENQIEESRAKWDLGKQAAFVHASPYQYNPVTFIQAAEDLAAFGADVVVMDCMGYNEKMKAVIAPYLPDAEVSLSNELLFQYVEGLLKTK